MEVSQRQDSKAVRVKGEGTLAARPGKGYLKRAANTKV